MNYEHNPEECIDKLRQAVSIEDLKGIWFGLSSEARQDWVVEAAKDEMKAKLTAEFDRQRTFISREFPSPHAGEEDSVARIFWGGSLEKPDASCTCQKWKEEKWCEHIDRLWNDEMTGIQRRLVVNHYQMYDRLGIKHKA